MPTDRTSLPYATLQPGDELVRVTAPVSKRDRATIITGLGDINSLTLVTQYAFQRAAEFVRTHDIKSYDLASHAGFLAFLRDGTAPRAPASADAHDGRGNASSVQRSDANAPRVSKRDAESRPGRGRSGKNVQLQEE